MANPDILRDASSKAGPICSACLDLSHDHFKSSVTLTDTFRTHNIHPRDIYAAAGAGCKTCSITLTEHDPILPIFGHAEEVPTHLELSRCMKILHDWLQACNARHELCAAPQSILPKRLIRVSNGTIRLVSTRDLAYSKYMTLSHCWGKSPNMMKTLKSNIASRHAGIAEEELPQVFKDAIRITRWLGCQWIWIDTLFIIQDDADDWKEEAAKMAHIYSDSYLNIAATFSASSAGSYFKMDRQIHGDYNDHADGHFKMWPLESRSICSDCARSDLEANGLRVRAAHIRSHLYITDAMREDREQINPLLDRAWAFQERLLAPRNLHLERSELIWECNSMLACECTGLSDLVLGSAQTSGSSATTEDIPEANLAFYSATIKAAFAKACHGKATKKEMHNLWITMIQSYSTLALTFQTDRIYALAGISSRFAAQTQSKYLAGIWAADLPRSLLWVPWPRSIEDRRRRLSPTFPSWSWMSIYDSRKSNATLYFPDTSEECLPDDRLIIHFETTFCEWADGTSYGGVASGQLEMTAAVMPCRIMKEQETNNAQFVVYAGASSMGIAWVDCPAIDQVDSFIDVLCLYVGTSGKSLVRTKNDDGYALLLSRVAAGERYKKIGIMFLDMEKVDRFDRAEVRRVQII